MSVRHFKPQITAEKQIATSTIKLQPDFMVKEQIFNYSGNAISFWNIVEAVTAYTGYKPVGIVGTCSYDTSDAASFYAYRCYIDSNTSPSIHLSLSKINGTFTATSYGVMVLYQKTG